MTCALRGLIFFLLLREGRLKYQVLIGFTIRVGSLYFLKYVGSFLVKYTIVTLPKPRSSFLGERHLIPP